MNFFEIFQFLDLTVFFKFFIKKIDQTFLVFYAFQVILNTFSNNNFWHFFCSGLQSWRGHVETGTYKHAPLTTLRFLMLTKSHTPSLSFRKLNPYYNNKTKISDQINPLLLDLSIESTQIEQVTDHRILVVIIDHKLDWHQHINYMCNKISSNLFLMSKSTPLVSTHALTLLFHAHILSYLNYCSTLWCNASEFQLKRLNSLHKRGIKLLAKTSSLTTEIFLKFHFLPFRQQLTSNGCVIMYKFHLEKNPSFINVFFQKGCDENRSCLYRLPLLRIDSLQK